MKLRLFAIHLVILIIQNAAIAGVPQGAQTSTHWKSDGIGASVAPMLDQSKRMASPANQLPELMLDMLRERRG
jgi:hypothetical protein